MRLGGVGYAGASALEIGFAMPYLALILVLALTFAGDAPAREQIPIRYALSNGLDVVLVPDHRVPKVAVGVSYRVGSMNEPPGRSGFAHLFEHLMFSGTPAWPNIDVAFGAVGVDINAWTWEDRTYYHAEGLSSTLPFILSVEADRMANQGAAIDKEDLDVQRAVVLNEMRENVLDYVNGSGWEAIRTALFPAPHPYSRAVIGSMADLAAATLEDVHAFFDAYYSPNNAILAIVGDFDPEDAKALIAKTFGRVPRGPEVAPPHPPELAPARARIELEDKTPTPTIALGWSVPGFTSPELGPLQIASELLSNPEYGVLRRALVDKGLATGAWAWLERGYLGSRFLIEVSAAEGADAAAVEAAAREAVAGFVAGPVDPADLERARKRILLSHRVALEPLRARAELVALYTEMFDAPERALVDDPSVAGATPEAMAKAVRRLDPDDATVLIVQPGDRGGYPEVLTASSGIAEPLPRSERPAVEVPRLEAREPELGALPGHERATLSNGMMLVHYRLPGAPMTYVAARSTAGTLSAPEGREGLIELAVMMGPRGTEALDPDTFGKAVKDLGADVDWKADDVSTFLTLATPPESIGPAVALFADALRHPRFDAAEWDVAVAATIDMLASREGDLPDVAARAAEATLFPKRPGEPAIDRSIASVRAVTREEAKATYVRIFTPAGVTFYSVGPQPLAEVVAALNTSLSDWTEGAEPFPPVVRRPAEFPGKTRVLLVPEPGASQSAIYLARPAPGFDEPGHAESVAVLRLLSLDFISRLNSVIREEKGYSYGTDGEFAEAVRKGSVLAIDTTVERENTGPALTEILTGFAGLATVPVREAELQRTVMAYESLIAGTGETAHGLFDQILGQLGHGSSLEEEHARRLEVTRLALDAVRAQAVRLAALDNAVIVIAGDPEVVAPQLETIGLAPEIVARPN